MSAMIAAFRAEMMHWRHAGLSFKLWLRDDDAVAVTPALERLLALSVTYHVPILLAVIPVFAEKALARKLVEFPLVTPCQHGFSHHNHANPGMRPIEFGGRPIPEMVADLSAGRRRLQDVFDKPLPPILVPPWNRIDPDLPALLPGLGFTTLSTFGANQFSQHRALSEHNCHVDIVAWREGRKGFENVMGQLIVAMEKARLEGGRAVGLLTHHLVHDAAAWSVLEKLCAIMAREDDVVFADIRDLLPLR